jgi:hypothetical protein
MPKPLGKAALTAVRKNDETVATFIGMLARVSDTDELAGAARATGLRLGRVTKMLGCGHVDVLLQDGTTEKPKISPTIAFNGRAASKSDRKNCILVGDFVVICEMVRGKVPLALVEDIEAEFERIGVSAPTGFFRKGGAGGAGDADDEPTWEFDRSVEKAAALEATTAATATSAAAVSEIDIDTI